MLRVLFCLISLCVSSTVFAQNAKAELQSKLAEIKTFSSQFSQSVFNDTNTVIQQNTGTMIMARPGQLRWETLTPDETTLIADGEKVYYVDTFLEQVSIYVQSKLTANNPMMLLSSDDPALWGQFNVAMVATPQENEQSFVISSNGEANNIVTVELQFIADTLTNVKVVDTQGQSSSFVFSEQQTNLPLASNTFTYEVPSSFTVDNQTGTP